MINAGINTVSLGTMTTKIGLYRQTQTKNERGAIENTYEKVCEVYANVVENAQPEAVMDSNIIALNTIEVKIYIVRELTTRWRIEYEGKMYNILSKTNAPRQPIIILKAEQVME